MKFPLLSERYRASSAPARLFPSSETLSLIKPLRELNDAAKKIAEGDLSVSLSHQTKDEVGMLADSFQQTVSHLQKYIDYINGLACNGRETELSEAIRKELN